MALCINEQVKMFGKEHEILICLRSDRYSKNNCERFFKIVRPNRIKVTAGNL